MNAISAIQAPGAEHESKWKTTKTTRQCGCTSLCFFLLVLSVSFPLRLIILPRNIDVREENYVRHDGSHDTADCGACCSDVSFNIRTLVMGGCLDEILTSKVHCNKVHSDRNDDHGDGESEKFHDYISGSDVLVRVREGAYVRDMY